MKEKDNVIIEYVDGDVDLIKDVSMIRWGMDIPTVNVFVEDKIKLTVMRSRIKSILHITNEELKQIEGEFDESY